MKGVRTSFFLYKICEREYLFCPDGIQKNKGLNLGAEPPHIRPRCRVLARVKIKALILDVCTVRSPDRVRICFSFFFFLIGKEPHG